VINKAARAKVPGSAREGPGYWGDRSQKAMMSRDIAIMGGGGGGGSAGQAIFGRTGDHSSRTCRLYDLGRGEKIVVFDKQTTPRHRKRPPANGSADIQGPHRTKDPAQGARRNSRAGLRQREAPDEADRQAVGRALAQINGSGPATEKAKWERGRRARVEDGDGARHEGGGLRKGSGPGGGRFGRCFATSGTSCKGPEAARMIWPPATTSFLRAAKAALTRYADNGGVRRAA